MVRFLLTPFIFLGLVVNMQAEEGRPTPCKPPPLFEGKFRAMIGNEHLFGEYFNDAYGERFRMRLSFSNQTVASDQLTLFREKLMYDISYEEKRCEKKPVNIPFPPMTIPPGAEFVSQFMLGTSSEPKEGMLLNLWSGTSPQVKGRYEVVFSQFGCMPISTHYYAEETGSHTTVFYDAVLGITDPNVFIPPSFCEKSHTEMNTEEVDG